MAARGVANLVITDKRSDGYPTSQSWGMDWVMSDLARGANRPGAYQNDAGSVPEWELIGTRAVPALNAVILQPIFAAGDMDLDDWTQEASTYFKEVQPTGFDSAWLKYYDATEDQYGTLRSNSALTINPSWALNFLRAQPAHDQAEPVAISITVGVQASMQYQLYIPQRWIAGAAAPDSRYPSLWKSEDTGATWSLVDECRHEGARSWAQEAFDRPTWVWWLTLGDYLVIYLGDTCWVYHEAGLEIPAGMVEVTIEGGQAAFQMEQIQFTPSGTIERLVGIIPPEYITDDPDTIDTLGDVDDQRTIVATMETAGDTIWPKAALATSDPYHTPVLYAIQATREAVYDEGDASLLFDNVVNAGDKGKLHNLRWTIAQDWRGSSFSGKLLTAQGYDEYGLTGNERAQLSISLDTTPPVYHVVGTGYLVAPEYPRDPQLPSNEVIELQFRDRLSRLERKAVGDCPAFDGWYLSDALNWLFCQIGGVDPAELLLDDTATEYQFAWAPGSLNLKFDAQTRVVDAADQICRAAGRTWGVDQLGQVFTATSGDADYDGTPDYTLDESTVTEEDHIYPVHTAQDVSQARNQIVVLGTDAAGNEVRACWRMTDSMSNPTSSPYLGDLACDVMVCPPGADPYLLASLQGRRLATAAQHLIWQTNGKPNLLPGMFVAVTIGGIGVSPGTVMRIIESQGSLNEQGECASAFCAVAV